jgi:hypothetical protein
MMNNFILTKIMNALLPEGAGLQEYIDLTVNKLLKQALNEVKAERMELSNSLLSSSKQERDETQITKKRDLTFRVDEGQDDLAVTYGSEGWNTPVTWQVDKFLPSSSVTFLFGKSQDLKTFAVLELACCIATKKKFSGLHTEQGLVFIIAGESPASIPRRIKAFEEHNKRIVGSKIVVINSPLSIACASSALKLNKLISEEVEKQGMKPALVIFDTFSQCAIDIDENNAKEVANYIRGCNRLAIEFKVAVLTVHHLNRSGTFRGSSAFQGNADVLLESNRCDTSGEIKTRLKVTKIKDGETNITTELTFVKIALEINDNAGNAIESLAVSDIKLLPSGFEHDLTTLELDCKFITQKFTMEIEIFSQKLLVELLIKHNKKENGKELQLSTAKNRISLACKKLLEDDIISGTKQGQMNVYILVSKSTK